MKKLSQEAKYKESGLFSQHAKYNGKRERFVGVVDTRGKTVPELAVVNGKLAIVLKQRETPAPVLIKAAARSRFTTESATRTLPEIFRLKSDKGAGKSCALRVVRRTIHVGRPEYQGAGVWS